MRLWHYKFVPVLPTSQLLGVWNECIHICEEWAVEGYIKDSLNSYLEVCPLVDFMYYMELVYLTMKRKGFKVDEYTKAKIIDWFYVISLHDNVDDSELCYDGDLREVIRENIFPETDDYITDEDLIFIIFVNKHDETYIQICYYAMYERYLRGLIPEKEWKIFNDEALKYA